MCPGLQSDSGVASRARDDARAELEDNFLPQFWGAGRCFLVQAFVQTTRFSIFRQHFNRPPHRAIFSASRRDGARSACRYVHNSPAVIDEGEKLLAQKRSTLCSPNTNERLPSFTSKPDSSVDCPQAALLSSSPWSQCRGVLVFGRQFQEASSMVARLVLLCVSNDATGYALFP